MTYRPSSISVRLIKSEEKNRQAINVSSMACSSWHFTTVLLLEKYTEQYI